MTVPHALRPRIAYDRRLLPRLYRIFYSSIQRFYQRRLAELGHPDGRTGSVTAIQRASGDLRLNPHLHGVFIDGVYVQDGHGELSLTALPALSELDVQELLQSIAARMLGYLRRHGLLTEDDTALAATHDADDEQLVLDALATAAVTGTSLAGPQSRPGRLHYLQEASGEPRTTSPLCAAYAGFSLHARTTVEHDDKPGRQRLIKYILRPPLAAERVERLEGGRVRLRLKRAFSDGTWALEMDELSLVARLAALVPPPWQNQVRYSGVLSPASQWRARIVPKPPQPETADGPACDHAALPTGQPETPAPATPKGKGCRYWPWRMLKARTFGLQTTTCPHCDGQLVFRALVKDPGTIHRFLTHLGLPTQIPRPAPARGPPYYRGKVHRLRAGGGQQDLLS